MSLADAGYLRLPAIDLSAKLPQLFQPSSCTERK